MSFNLEFTFVEDEFLLILASGQISIQLNEHETVKLVQWFGRDTRLDEERRPKQRQFHTFPYSEEYDLGHVIELSQSNKFSLASMKSEIIVAPHTHEKFIQVLHSVEKLIKAWRSYKAEI